MASLSRLEIALLSALAHAGRPVYAAVLKPRAEARLRAPVNRGAVARALRTLGRRGLAREIEGPPAPHGGPNRAFYEISPSGRAALAEEVEAFQHLIRGRSLSASAIQLLVNPPRGSKVAAAKAYGVDLVDLQRAALQTPQERLRDAVSAANALMAFHR